MNNTLYIPKKIKVGFNNRSDTYTKKLGYVIYWDDKGVLRQENSWEGWRDKKIDPLELENVPTEGFVLNKGVGGVRQSYGWNARNEYIRVYDPRGFEFEISVANLLFILQECTSTKGKGLEGEFIYSWDSKNLVLLPVDSQEYRKSTEYTSNLKTKVDKSMMVPGRMYLFKNTTIAMYLGRYEINRTNYSNKIYREKKHIFLHENYGNSKDLLNSLIIENGFTNLSKVLNEEVSESFSDYLENFINSEHHQVIKTVISKEVTPPKIKKDYDWRDRNLQNCLVKISDNHFKDVSIDYDYRVNGDKKYYLKHRNNYSIDNNEIKSNYIYETNNFYIPYEIKNNLSTIEELKRVIENDIQFHKLYYVFENELTIEYNTLKLKYQ